MRRGDVIVVAAPGDFGKHRPAVIVQSDLFNPTHASIAVCLLTSDIADAPLFRLTVEPSPENGLRSRSDIMVDKIVALRRDRLGEPIGHLDRETMLRLDRSLALFLGLGD